MSKKKHKKHGGKHGKHAEAEETAAVVPEPVALAPVAAPADAAPAAAAGAAEPDRKIMYEPIREYRLKFYLNAQHYVVFDGKRGQTHPHTWEFTLTIEVLGLEPTPFSKFERGIEAHLATYQNQVMNEMEPFDTMLPTLENLVEEFSEPFSRIVEDAGGRLVALEGSEGPTRSYILRERTSAQAEFERQDLEAQRASVIDRIVGEALEE